MRIKAQRRKALGFRIAAQAIKDIRILTQRHKALGLRMS